MPVKVYRKKANRAYDEKAYDQVTLRVPKAMEIRMRAERASMSVSAYIIDALRRQIETEYETAARQLEQK